jgi:hypothetical protein
MITMSKHADRRRKQGGVNMKLLSAIFENADVDVPIGSNCRLLRVHKQTAAGLRLGDRLKRHAIIWSDDAAQIVTVIPLRSGRRGSRYRKTN